VSSTSAYVVGIGQYVLDFQFKFSSAEAIHRNWEFTGIYMFEGDYIDWEVYMFGGSNKMSVLDDDPIVVDDRGLWFDGQNSFCTIIGLVLHHTFSISVWVMPHGSGTIFNAFSPVKDSFDIERSMYWSISEYSMEWADTFHHSYTSFNAVSLYEWQHSSISLIWEQESGQTSIIFTKNGKNNVT
jgi:hypothetical protein